jgi:predicted PurR-regulated permease PerM
MPRRELYNYFFFIFLIGLLVAVGKILSPFSGSLLSAFVLAVTFYPFYEWLGRHWPPAASARAFLLVLMVLLFVVIPVALLAWTLVAESESLTQLLQGTTQAIEKWRSGQVHSPVLMHVRGWFTRALGISPSQFQQNVFGRLSAGLGAIGKAGAHLAENALKFLFHLLVMFFALFFFFRDGRSYQARFESLFPMNDHDTAAVTRKINDTVVGVVRGWLLTSLIQGACATIGYAMVGVPAPVLFGALTALIGLIPIVGTFGVWVPVGIYLLFSGTVWKGIVLLAWGALVVVGVNDVWVRPYLVGQQLDLPLLPLFFALLGGVEVFGAKGIIVGPLAFSLAPLLLEIYRRRFLVNAAPIT